MYNFLWFIINHIKKVINILKKGIGLIQNYIDFINDGDHPVIHSALENVLLSKGKKICESI